MAQFDKHGKEEYGTKQSLAELSAQMKGVKLSVSSNGQPPSQSPISTAAQVDPQQLVFVEEPIPNDLCCPLCLDVLTEPCLTSCGHQFCSQCVNPLMAASGSYACPVCREERFSIMRNRAVERQILALPVYCSFRGKGCSWVGPKGDLDDHVMKCTLADMPCLFKKFGCQERVLRTNMNAHLTEKFSEHMFMLTSAKKTQQQVMEAMIEEKDKKIDALEQRLQSLEVEYSKQLKLKSDILWHPLPLNDSTLIGGFFAGTPQGCTYQYQLPACIPGDAKEVLLHVVIRMGSSLPNGESYWLNVYVKDGQMKLFRALRITACTQKAFSDNSENMWFPVTANRLVFLEVSKRTKPIERDAKCCIYVIGYK